MNDNEKRMAGSYEITHSVQIGSKEIVIGVDKTSENGKYYCGNCERCEILELFTNGVTSNNYPKIMQIFAERISQAAKEILNIIEAECHIVGDDHELKIDDCSRPISAEDNIHQKIVIIDGNVLRPEFQRAPHQLVYVTGGNGSYPNARGRKVFTKNLLNGQEHVFYRNEILGIVDVDKLPRWAKEGYQRYIANVERGER